MQLHPRRADLIHGRERYEPSLGGSYRILRPECRRPKRTAARADPDPVPAARRRRGPLPGQAHASATLVEVSRDVFRDGHEKLRAVVRTGAPARAAGPSPSCTRSTRTHNGVRWGGSFVVDATGRWEFDDRGLDRPLRDLARRVRRKLGAGQHDLAASSPRARCCCARRAARAKGPDRKLIEHALRVLEDDEIPDAAKHDAALGQELYAAVERNAERHGPTRLDPPLALEVDRVRARFGAWYELFPRSWGGLAGVEAQLPALAELGFDVVYLPPIHPIGLTNRKGRNNALVAGPDDPGSPYAIGAAEGGHDAVHPELGTIEDVRRLCATAAEHDMDVAMDFAINASADHPWLADHPDWFHRRPDGTLKYAENPPKQLPGHLQRQLGLGGWLALWRRCATRLVLGRLRRAGLPRRQPAPSRSSSGSGLSPRPDRPTAKRSSWPRRSRAGR